MTINMIEHFQYQRHSHDGDFLLFNHVLGFFRACKWFNCDLVVVDIALSNELVAPLDSEMERDRSSAMASMLLLLWLLLGMRFCRVH